MNPSAATRLLADLGVLYELSLAIGASLDFDECCDGFLKPLMARRGLSLAAVWEQGDDGSLRLAHANPRSAIRTGIAPAVVATLRPRPGRTLRLERPALEALLGRPARIGTAVSFDLGRGVLLLAAAREAALDDVACEQLRTLVAKFAIALDGCRAHAALAGTTARAELLALVARSTDSAVVVTDAQRRVVWVNASFERVTGYPLAAVRGRSPGQVLQGAGTDPDTVARIRAALDRRASFTEELLNYRRDGAPYWVSLSVSPIDAEAPDGVAGGFIAIQRDVTVERRRREELERARAKLEEQAQELARAREIAERASAEKTRFLAQTSHELRTPLTAIVGYAELLERRAASPETAREWIRRIRASADHLLELIGGVLDLSSIEEGSIEVRREPVRIAALLTDIGAALAPRAEAKGLTLQVDIAPGTPDDVETDRRCLRQIVENLAANAVKYTRTGSVRLATRPTPGLLCIDVDDTGPGIPADRLARIFEPFVRVHDDTAGTEGAGLGLAIARRLARAIDANLDVTSRPGVGTTFTICLPAALPAPRPTAVPATPDLRARRILLAEDSDEIADLVELFLLPTHATLTRVADGESAVRTALDARDAAAPFDLILMDLQMPILDGITATRRLRAAGWTAPIVALTATASPDDLAALRAAGCDDHLSKPVTEAELLRLVGRWLG